MFVQCAASTLNEDSTSSDSRLSLCGVVKRPGSLFLLFSEHQKMRGKWKDTNISLFRGVRQSKAWKTVSRIIKAESTEAVSLSLWCRGFDHLRWRQRLCSPNQDAENIPTSQQKAPIQESFHSRSLQTATHGHKVLLYFNSFHSCISVSVRIHSFIQGCWQRSLLLSSLSYTWIHNISHCGWCKLA